MDLSNSSTNDAPSPGPDAKPTSTVSTSSGSLSTNAPVINSPGTNSLGMSSLSITSLPTSTIPTSPGPMSGSFFGGNANVAVGANKMYSKNANGTAILTTVPGNDAELQLYRVMQRASLLVYYDTLLEMGGDDVQQLCDAGEEEFLEIMALVGMASKPLHVRRFQKSLQEWMIDPSAFQVPLASPSSSTVECYSRRSILETSTRPIYSPSPGGSSPVPSATPSRSSGSRSSSPVPSGVTDAVLSEIQISRLRTAAERVSSRLPNLKPRVPVKRRIGRELDAVIALSETDPKRMDAIRRYAAIYGRFDCKRRPEKPLTLHEISVNEAAAQLCHFVPALLTRRDELFPLARQLVRDAGVSAVYTYSTNNASKQWPDKNTDVESETEEEPPSKKQAVADIVTS